MIEIKQLRLSSLPPHIAQPHRLTAVDPVVPGSRTSTLDAFTTDLSKRIILWTSPSYSPRRVSLSRELPRRGSSRQSPKDDHDGLPSNNRDGRDRGVVLECCPIPHWQLMFTLF
jgi:hypothetical protein